MADKKFNIKDQLAGIAALIAAIVAIGGGFVKYGEVMTRLDVLTKASKTVDKVSIEMVTANEKDIEFLQQEVDSLKNKKETVVDLSGIESDISDIDSSLAKTKTKSLVNAKEIELLQVQIEEIKVSTSNPLTN
jgi:nitrous oxide reductase